MNLLVEIKPDFDGTISITDYSRELDEYIPETSEDTLLSYYKFKYSLTCTIDVVLYISTTTTTDVVINYTDHETETDSIRIPISKDGHYRVYHVILPTTDWIEKFKDEDLSEYYNIYVTDGVKIYKYLNSQYYEVTPDELIEINPYRTTISILAFDIFNTFGLRKCYTKLSKVLLSKYPNKCNTIDKSDRENRDILWMTLNVIHFCLLMNNYTEALRILEGLSCSNLCESNTSDNNGKKSCGCKKYE